MWILGPNHHPFTWVMIWTQPHFKVEVTWTLGLLKGTLLLPALWSSVSHPWLPTCVTLDSPLRLKPWNRLWEWAFRPFHPDWINQIWTVLLHSPAMHLEDDLTLLEDQRTVEALTTPTSILPLWSSYNKLTPPLYRCTTYLHSSALQASLYFL